MAKQSAFTTASGLILTSAFVAGLAGIYVQSSKEADNHRNFGSLKGVESKLAEEIAKAANKEPAKVDYFKALQSRLKLLSYPYDKPNESALTNALKHAEGMPKAQLFKVSATDARMAPAIALTPTAWEFIGPKNLGVPYEIFYGPTRSALNGRIGGLAFSPTDSNTIYMGAPAGGIWKSTDRGVTWATLGNDFSTPYYGPIAVSSANPNVVLAGNGDRDGFLWSGNGVKRSTNGGQTWTNIDFPAGGATSEIVFDPTDGTTVLAGSVSNGGLYRSTDSGATWTRMTVNGRQAFTATDISVGAKDTNGNHLYILRTQGNGLHISTNKGLTWTSVTEPGNPNSSRNHVDLSHINFGVAYYSDSSGRRLWKGVLTNGNFVWTNISAGFPSGYNWSQSWYDHHVTVATHRKRGQLRDFVYVGLITLAVYDGDSWRDLGATYTDTPRTHNDQHCMAVFPGNENRIVFGNDGGLYPAVYNEQTDNWDIENYASRELGITMFYSGAWHPTNEYRMIGGTQDNASPVSIDNIANWKNVTGGDGMGCAINPVNPEVSYGSSQNNGLYRTNNFWINSTFFGPPDDFGSDNVPFVTRMGVDPSSPNPLYVGSNFLNRFNPQNGTWNQRLGGIELGQGGGTVLAVTVAPSNPQIIYVSTDNALLWRSADRGATWRRLDNIASMNYPGTPIQSIDVHPTRPNDVLVTFTGGIGSSPVRRIADASATNPTMVSVSGTGLTRIPDIATNSLTRDEQDPDNKWFVGNQIGVYSTIDGGTTWQNMTQPLGLPISEVSTIKWTPGTGFLNIATYGRGMWRLRMSDVSLDRRPGLVYSGNIARVQGRYVLSATITNTGRQIANDIRINSAVISTTNGPGTPTTRFPVRVGSINYTSRNSFQLNFTGPNQVGIATVTYNGTYILDGRTINFSRTVVQPFPQ